MDQINSLSSTIPACYGPNNVGKASISTHFCSCKRSLSWLWVQLVLGQCLIWLTCSAVLPKLFDLMPDFLCMFGMQNNHAHAFVCMYVCLFVCLFHVFRGRFGSLLVHK